MSSLLSPLLCSDNKQPLAISLPQATTCAVKTLVQKAMWGDEHRRCG